MPNNDTDFDPYYEFEVWETEWRAKNDPDYKKDLLEVIDIYYREAGDGQIRI